MLKNLINIMKDERGISISTEMMIMIAITAVVATTIGTAVKGKLTTGSDNVGTLLDTQFSAAGVGGGS